MMKQTSRNTFQMRPIYDTLLRGTARVPAGLYRLQLLTAAQLTTLHYRSGMLKTVKARLKTLTTSGYVQSDVVPSRKWRTPYYYTLGPAGVKYLESVGCDVAASWRASRETHQHALFVEHTLELNDVLISAFLLPTAVPTVRLHDFTHERELKRHPYKATWYTGSQPHTFTVIPVAFLDFYVTVGGELHRHPVLVEHDRGTEEQYHFRRRIRAYLMLLTTGSYQQLFQSRAVTIAISTFQGAARVEQMRAWTRAELAKETAAIGDAFRFAALTRPLQPAQTWFGPQWLSPYEDDTKPLLAA